MLRPPCLPTAMMKFPCCALHTVLLWFRVMTSFLVCVLCSLIFAPVPRFWFQPPSALQADGHARLGMADINICFFYRLASNSTASSRARPIYFILEWVQHRQSHQLACLRVVAPARSTSRGINGAASSKPNVATSQVNVTMYMYWRVQEQPD
jgi:hypothetical protein